MPDENISFNFVRNESPGSQNPPNSKMNFSFDFKMFSVQRGKRPTAAFKRQCSSSTTVTLLKI